MTMQEPQLILLRQDTYQCGDIEALHHWLEGHGYRFYGQHNPGEYGRFSRQEHHESDDQATYIHSFIQVFSTGKIFAPGPDARELLTTLCDQE